MAGYPVRFALPMFIILPFFNKYLVKGVNAIFGKPKEGLADESKYEEQKEQAEALAQQKQLMQDPEYQKRLMAAAAMQSQQIPAQSQPVQPSMQGNFNKLSQITYTGRNQGNEVSEKQKDVTSKPDNGLNAEEDDTTYIPSTAPVQVTNQDTISKATEKALKKLDYLEKVAIKKVS